VQYRLAVLYVGTDEAGYGPLLGPLVVAATVHEADGPRRSLRAKGVADSKVVYARGGRRALGRALGRYLDVAPPARLSGVLDRHSIRGDPRAGYSWYGDVAADDLEPGRPPASFRALYVNPVCERDFNRGCREWGGKAGVLFQETMRLVRRVLDEHPQADLDVCCDKHGGRHRYAGLLLAELGPSQIVPDREGAALSSYRLRVGGRDVHIRFVPKADAGDPTVALASMAAKYVRELFMQALNDYFTARVDGLKPTAGYYGDGRRFLDDIAAVLDGMDGGRESLVRCR